jgi:hypothetical protein
MARKKLDYGMRLRSRMDACTKKIQKKDEHLNMVHARKKLILSWIHGPIIGKLQKIFWSC